MDGRKDRCKDGQTDRCKDDLRVSFTLGLMPDLTLVLSWGSVWAERIPLLQGERRDRGTSTIPQFVLNLN